MSPERPGESRGRVFYDGGCGLCHGAVRFAVRRDRGGELFRFAPLDGPTARRLLGPERLAGLPDSLVLLTAGGRLLVESEAVLEMGRRLGGAWGLAARAAAVAPRGLRDAVYRFVARHRHRIWRRPESACPALPPALRERFDE